MKKKILAVILCAVMILSFATCFAGCKVSVEAGKNGEETTTEATTTTTVPTTTTTTEPQPDYTGTWELTRIKYQGVEINMSEYEGEEFVFIMVLKSNGTAVLTTQDETESGKWEVFPKGIKLIDEYDEMEFILEETGELSYTYTDEELEGMQLFLGKN